MEKTTEATGASSPEWLTREQAAEILEVSVSQIRKWEAKGRLRKKVETMNGKERVLVSAADVQAMAGAERDPLFRVLSDQLDTVYRVRNGAAEDLQKVIEQQRLELERCYRRIAETDKTIAEHNERQANTIKAIEAVTTAHHERELERMEFQRTQARRDTALAELKPLLRAGAARLGLPVGALGGADGSIAAAGRGFRDSLSEEQMMRIESVLTDKQKAALLMFFDAMGEDKPEGASGDGNGAAGTG